MFWGMNGNMLFQNIETKSIQTGLMLFIALKDWSTIVCLDAS